MAQKKRLDWKVVMMVVFFVVMLLSTAEVWASPKQTLVPPSISVSCYDAGDIELYNFGPYQSIYVAEEYIKLRDKILKEGRLVQASITIKQFRKSKNLLISHELIATKSKILDKNHKPYEYLTYMTDSEDTAKQYGRNAIAEENFIVKGAFSLEWAGKKVYLVSFVR